MTLSTHSVGEKEPPMTSPPDLEKGPDASPKAEQEYASGKKVASRPISDGDAKSDSPQYQAATKEEGAPEVDKMGNPAPKYPHGPKQVFFSWVAILFAVFLVSLVGISNCCPLSNCTLTSSTISGQDNRLNSHSSNHK
jgi:hypothetical protein